MKGLDIDLSYSMHFEPFKMASNPTDPPPAG